MNKNAVLDDEVIAVKTQSEELNKEIAALRAEIVSIKSELDLTLAVNALDFTHTEMEASPTKAPADSIEQTVITEMPMVPAEVREAPVLSSDSPKVERLMDTEDPQKESAGLSEGRSEIKQLNYDNAIEKFKNVEVSAADYVKARLGVANAYFYSHRYIKAIPEFNHVLAQDPNSIEAAIGLANSHYRLGQRAEQIAAYDRVIEMEPRQWLHFNSRATAHLMDDNNDQALRDFQEAARLAHPQTANQATALENIGLIHLKEQRWKVAYEHANEVNRLDTRHAWNWLIRGIAAAKLKRNVDAYVSFDNWFKYKLATDPYLLKEILPESIHAYVDVTPLGLMKLVDPPLISGQICENDSQCKSYACKPGAPANEINYCVAEGKDCSALNSNGYLIDEVAVVEGISARCYQPQAGNARWTREN